MPDLKTVLSANNPKLQIIRNQVDDLRWRVSRALFMHSEPYGDTDDNWVAAHEAAVTLEQTLAAYVKQRKDARVEARGGQAPLS